MSIYHIRNKRKKQEFHRTPEDIVPVVGLGDGNLHERHFMGIRTVWPQLLKSYYRRLIVRVVTCWFM
jgi:hypothetical protein